MQISVDTEILESIFTHATNAVRLASDIDNGIGGDALTRSIGEIHRMVAGLLGKPYDPQLTGEPTQDGQPEFNVADVVDLLRQLMARVDALANAAQSHLDEMVWEEKDGDRRQLERLAHLVGATSDAVQEAMEVGDGLAVELAMHRSGS